MQAITFGGLQQCTGLLAVQGLYLTFLQTRRVDVFCYIAIHYSPPLGLLQGAAQHGMGVLDGAGRKPPILHLTVEVLYVSWRELSELDAPNGRDDVAPYLSLVGGVCAGSDTSPDAVVEPPIQALPDTYVLVIDDEPTVPVSYGLGELLADLFAALAIDVAGFPTRSGLYSVLADPVSILAAVDRALIVAAPLRHTYHPFNESTLKGQPLGLPPASSQSGDALPACRPLCARWCCRRRRSSPPTPAKREPALSSVASAAPR